MVFKSHKHQQKVTNVLFLFQGRFYKILMDKPFKSQKWKFYRKMIEKVNSQLLRPWKRPQWGGASTSYFPKTGELWKNKDEK